MNLEILLVVLVKCGQYLVARKRVGLWKAESNNDDFIRFAKLLRGLTPEFPEEATCHLHLVVARRRDGKFNFDPQHRWRPVLALHAIAATSILAEYCELLSMLATQVDAKDGALVAACFKD
jgi:hypothetical protein